MPGADGVDVATGDGEAWPAIPPAASVDSAAGIGVDTSGVAVSAWATIRRGVAVGAAADLPPAKACAPITSNSASRIALAAIHSAAPRRGNGSPIIRPARASPDRGA